MQVNTFKLNLFKFIHIIDNFNPNQFGIFFSILLHLIIFFISIGIPNIFSNKTVNIPNIVPIEILNVAESTNLLIDKNSQTNEKVKDVKVKQKKFNSSNNLEVQKKIEVKENNVKDINIKDQQVLNINEKKIAKINEKQIENLDTKNISQPKENIETIKTKKLKPKLKPKLDKTNIINDNTDLQIDSKNKDIDKKNKIEKQLEQPKVKPKEDFSIASMLKDLRNETSNSSIDEIDEQVEQINQQNEIEDSKSTTLSISEIDLLRQQLSSCWNAPAGAVIERGMKVTITAKVKQNMQVLENSIRITDTNIPKSNAFYRPITDSAMRTLLNPECNPLKLPKNKYDLWKSLTITFDYSIMKGL